MSDNSEPEEGASEPIEFVHGGAELMALAQPLWEALFDHHLATGAGGIATIERELSWARRRAHYERLFAGHPRVELWLAVQRGLPIAYMLWHEDQLAGERVAVLESLSVLAQERGLGLGTQLMQLFDERARTREIALSAVDVLGGNSRAEQLYLRYGFEPLAEFWMRSREPDQGPTAVSEPLPQRLAELSALGAELGFELELIPGPDDTWISSEVMAMLSSQDDDDPDDDASATDDGSGAGASSGVDGERLTELFDALEAEGCWTIFVYIPAPPAATGLREYLEHEAFKLSMRRLTRVL